ncbi:hypothetical protein NLJ89_g10180 [Agrocybe chaxingu]|uniref:F-box domain-containing protein n=1 Tax=Agrocybe chaxingu TaxID=84603 RepID=A0A9W8JS77_9AGAR|nr:hypothetical protein NLJ89_g10180 [Agrocybe chaxingu]
MDLTQQLSVAPPTACNVIPHCLQIEEILSLILENVVECRNNKEVFDRASVLSVAKTCRRFREPALRSLWKSLYSVVPLLLTMPEDLLEREIPSEWHNIFQPRTITFRRPVISSDWERFDYYAPFVRRLGGMDSLERSPSAFFVMNDVIRHALEQRHTVLLPNLRTSVVSSNDLEYTSLFLTPSVHTLCFIMHPKHLQQLSHLAIKVPLEAANIKILRLSQSTSWKTQQQALFAHALAELLRGLDLEVFHCEWFSLSDEMMTTILGMPSLRELTACKEALAVSQILEAKPFSKPTIRKFSLRTHRLSPTSLPTILTNIRPSKLTEFRIRFSSGTCTQDNLCSLILAIASYCSTTSFVNFALEQEADATNEDDALPCPITFDTLKPLFQFSNLRELSLRELSLMHSFDLSDAEIKEMAQSWPRIEWLCCESSWEDLEPRTTLAGLLWLATYCRKLESLSYSFTGSGVFPEELMAPAAGHNLAFLSVGWSRIDNPSEVSDFLNTAFPKLVLLLWGAEPDSVDSEHWQEVQAQIQRS